MWEEYVGIVGVKMKFANTNRTDNGEGKPLCTCTLLLAVFFMSKYDVSTKKPTTNTHKICSGWYKQSAITDVEGRRLR